MELHDLVLQGNRRALARLISSIESGDRNIQPELDILFRYTGKAHLVGVTGATGSGKSSLVNRLVHYFRQENPDKRIGVVAVDPSSPFTGGAILGDRIRMKELVEDPGVFIRSMASRGSLGGIAQATFGVVQALEAAGYEMIFIETVGAGQSEVEIASLAHTTIVVDVPGLGDDIQAIKAGILEIGDIIVLNKADKPGVDAAERALHSLLDLAENVPGWKPEIILTVATSTRGIEDVAQTISRHGEYLHKTGLYEQKTQARLFHEVKNLIKDKVWNQIQNQIKGEGVDGYMQQVLNYQISPYQAACAITQHFKYINEQSLS